jgi:hypothetical protein
MATDPLPRQPLAAIWQALLLLLWGTICFFMLVSALIGLGCLVLGLLSLIVDLSGTLTIQFGGKPVQTVAQKLLFTGVGAVMAAAGIGFLWLCRRDSIRAALVLWALLLGFLALLVWLTGSAQILSVGE